MSFKEKMERVLPILTDYITTVTIWHNHLYLTEKINKKSQISQSILSNTSIPGKAQHCT